MPARARELLDRSTAVATALSPHIGYAATAEIAKESVRTGKSIHQIARERGVLTDAQLDDILSPERMTKPRMKRIILTLTALLTLTPLLLGQQKPPDKTPRKPRLFAPQDLGLLEPPDREAWQKPDQVMDALHVADSTVVADLGAGGGWFTVRLARRVGPNGRVYAVDVQRLMIEAIQRRVQREGYTNVTPILGDA